MSKLTTKIARALPSNILKYIEPIYYKLDIVQSSIMWRVWGKKCSIYETPIIINNYNRLSYLKRLIESLTKRGYNNIIILDNQSTYPPLLQFYETTQYEVVHLKKNYGYRALWESGIYNKYKRGYYVYTDVDMELTEDCPDDFLLTFQKMLEKYNDCFKVGCALKIDDLPSCYDKKEEVIKHESQFWEKMLEKDVYDATIDTTFALYRPFTGTSGNFSRFNIRMGGKFQIRHLPWYIDTAHPTDEDLFYTNSLKKPTHWSILNKK